MSRMLSLWQVALLALGAAWQWYIASPIQGGPIFSTSVSAWSLLLVPAAVLGTIGGLLEGWAAGSGHRLLAGLVALVASLPMLWVMGWFGQWFPDERYLGGAQPPLSWWHFVTPVCALIAFLILQWCVATFTASRVADRARNTAHS